MLSDLFAIVSGVAPDAVVRWVPPGVRHAPLAPASIRRDGADVLVECPILRSRQPGKHFLPAFSALTTATYSFRFEATVADSASPAWVGTAAIGESSFDSIADRRESLRSEIDVFLTDVPVSALRLRLRLRASDPEAVLSSTWMMTLSVCDPTAVEAPLATVNGSVALAVPPASQLDEGGPLGERGCSPTSVAMVLRHWGRAVTVPELAAEMFHPRLDLYGVWPCAIRAAARRGVPGYLLRFPDWSSAAWCLTQGLPIVASVRYEAGELTDAAIARTAGHLLVLTGFDGDHVLVNDPAAPTRITVPRRYRLPEFHRVWLDRTGVGYVFYPS